MILDSIISSSFKKLGNLSPFVALTSVHKEKHPLLFTAPPNLLYLRIQVIVPSLPALLPDPAWQVLSNKSPFLRTIFLNEMENHSVFLFSPGSLDQAWVENFLPTVQTLDICSAWQIFCYFLPILASVSLHCFLQLLVLQTLLIN